MKKRLIILLLILISIESFSQADRVGLNIFYRRQNTLFDHAAYDNIDGVSGLKTNRGALGASIFLPLKNKTGMEMGLCISNIGRLYKNDKEDIYRDYRLTYLKLPILINFSGLKREGRFLNPRIAFGPQPSFLINSKVLESHNSDMSSSQEIELVEDYNRAVLDLCIKSGIDIKVNPNTFIYIGINLDMSLTAPLEKISWASNYNGTIYSGESYSKYFSAGIEFGMTFLIN